MKRTLLLLIFDCLVQTLLAQPRNELVDLRCGTLVEHSTTLFAANFISTMETISDQMQTTGFGRAQVGTGPDANYGLSQCYGDLTLPDCVLCFSEIHLILPSCFPYNAGRIYLDGCFMRLQNYSFYEEITGPEDKRVCGNETRKSFRFQESVKRALVDAVTEAPENRGFASPRAIVSGPRNESAFVLANCWRTLNVSACRVCLENASASVMGCLPWSEGRALNAGCFLRYSDTNFLNVEETLAETNSKMSKTVIIAIVVSSVAAVLIGLFVGSYIRARRIIKNKRKKGSNESFKRAKSIQDSSLHFKFSTLCKATSSFDEANMLGQGGFGRVYKGVLEDGRDIAVKRLFVNNKHRAEDFYNEVNLISTVNHKNLVRLLGCSCFPESLLVYEYLPNMSLDRFLFDANRGKALSWQKRFEIILGTTEGLVYLHENENVRILHRDIKASNILLDSKLRAKIADFGLARNFENDKSHISTAIVGTLGYMAPEYLAYGQLTDKADVYSFGVLLLEIVAGRKNNKESKDWNDEISDSLIVTAWKHFQNGTSEEIFDPNLMLQNYSDSISIKNDILRVLNVGLLCTQQDATLRPSMSTTLQMLSKKDGLPAPSNPPFIDEKTMALNDTSEDPWPQQSNSCSPSVASMSFSGFHPR